MPHATDILVPVTAVETNVKEEKSIIRLLNAYFRLYSFVVVCKRIVGCHPKKKKSAKSAEP